MTKQRIVFSLDAARVIVLPWRVCKADATWEVRAGDGDGDGYLVCECQDGGIAEFLVEHHNAQHERLERQQKGSVKDERQTRI